MMGAPLIRAITEPIEPGPEAARSASNSAVPQLGSGGAPQAPGPRPGQPGELSPEIEAVVSRWNPQGVALLKAVRRAGDASAVTLIGPDDANTTLLRTELARYEPRIALGDPVADAHAAVESTSPSGQAPAAVALVLLDAGTTLGGDTLRMLQRLRQDGTRILLAMNGIHAHQDWRSVRELNLGLLAGAGLGDIDVLPVSGRLAVAARASGDPGLMDRAGLGALHAELTAAAMGADAAGADRTAAITVRVLAETRRRIEDQIEQLRSGGEIARLREERATLLAGRDGGRATSLSTLRGQLHLARVDLLTDVGGRVRALHTAARGELDRLRPNRLGDYPDRLQQAVTELTGQLDAEIDQRLAELAHRVDELSPAEPAPYRRRDPAPRVGPDPDPRHRGVEDHLMIALGASAGVGLGRLLVSPLALVPALDVASVPFTLLLGAGAAAWVVRARGQVADRNHVRQWVSEALVNVKAQLEQRVTTALVETETAFSDRVVRASATAMVETDRRIAELEARIRRMAAEQPGQLAACQRDIECLDRWVPPSD
ncbi:hypothetical protein [Nocardia arthritidis]|uniref:Uncharacterized protein n=1 Tax=Nocardia arthritidis TaxID=228602 RepID=A0A6G9YTU6_9NOCA|nr:hypothetical protein [Nocardia arthritidis]QIS16638.1 hypothetical protein F5544_44175 [Nocardia arthritidis]